MHTSQIKPTPPSQIASWEIRDRQGRNLSFTEKHVAIDQSFNEIHLSLFHFNYRRHQIVAKILSHLIFTTKRCLSLSQRLMDTEIECVIRTPIAMPPGGHRFEQQQRSNLVQDSPMILISVIRFCTAH